VLAAELGQEALIELVLVDVSLLLPAVRCVAVSQLGAAASPILHLEAVEYETAARPPEWK